MPDGASTTWSYKFLEGERELVVPASPYLTNLAVEDCDRLESLKLIGFYPQLSEISLRNVGRLRYLGAPYGGDAPQLNFPSGLASIGELTELRLLKLPGTSVTDAALNDDVELPPSVVEVDLRGTRTGDQWLGRLAELPALATVRIGECTNMSSRAKDEFRRSRPDVELDEHTLHRPHDASHPPVHPDARQ